MDPLSQGALGAAAAVAFAPRDRAGWAGILGGLSGMAPDLDVLIRSPSDPLLFLEYHRQFTHSLAFIPFGALVCAVVLLPLVRRRIPFRAAYGFCLLGYATHGLLDACTSYGTQLLWPFSDLRVAWNNVSIIDPLFTLPVLALVLLAAFRQAPILGRVACAWAVAYLLLGVVQRERAESFGGAVAAERGHEVLRIEAKPAFGSLLLWKTIYETEHRIHVDALRLGWDPRRFPGQSATKLDVLRDLPWLQAASQQWRDLERFRWFSDGNVALDPEHRDHVIDVRYSLLPNRIDALWGIRLDRRAPKDAHVRFYTSRGLSPAHRSELFRMLFD